MATVMDERCTACGGEVIDPASWQMETGKELPGSIGALRESLEDSETEMWVCRGCDAVLVETPPGDDDLEAERVAVVEQIIPDGHPDLELAAEHHYHRQRVMMGPGGVFVSYLPGMEGPARGHYHLAGGKAHGHSMGLFGQYDGEMTGDWWLEDPDYAVRGRAAH